MRENDVVTQLCLVGGLLITLSLIAPASASTLRTVALTGAPAAGVSDSATFSTFATPALNAAGQTAFWASLSGSGVVDSNNSGIWSEGPGALDLVAREGSQAPDLPAGVVFNSLGVAAFNSAGQTAFSGSITGSGVDTSNDGVVWSEGSGALKLIAREGNPAPGAPNGIEFDSNNDLTSAFGSVRMNSAGQTVFRAGLSVPTFHGGEDGIWLTSPTQLEPVAVSGAQGPGMADGVTFGAPSAPVLNSSGEVAFRANTSGEGESGVWAGEPDALRLVAQRGTPAPGLPESVSFQHFSYVDLNSSGRTAFTATLEGAGVDNTNRESIWSEGSGSLSLVARRGDNAPGAAAGVTFSVFGFHSPVINSAGAAAFSAILSDDSIGVWSDRSGALEPIVQSGDQIPGVPGAAEFASLLLLTPVLNSAGQVAFRGSLAGEGVDASNDEGIWAEDPAGALRLVVRTGDLLEVAPNEFRTVRELYFEQSTGNDDGRGSGFNDSGQLAFHAMFTDGTEGIFVSDLVTTPQQSAVFQFAGTAQRLTRTLVNAYSDETIPVDEERNVNTGVYYGTVGLDDEIILTDLGDALFIRDESGNQVVRSVELFSGGPERDLLILADEEFSLEDTTIHGRAGNDILWANVGDDEIDAGPGDDVVNGGPGADRIRGGPGDDELRGGDGDDILLAGTGDDFLRGGSGNDTLYAGGEGVKTLWGDVGADRFVLTEPFDLFFSDGGAYINDFSVAEGDALDISSVLIGYDPLTDTLSDLISLQGAGDEIALFVYPNGIPGGGTQGFAMAVIYGLADYLPGAVATEQQLQQLVAEGALIVEGRVPEPTSAALVMLAFLGLALGGARLQRPASHCLDPRARRSNRLAATRPSWPD